MMRLRREKKRTFIFGEKLVFFDSCFRGKKEDIEKMVQDAEKYKEEDEKYAKKVEILRLYARW